jgi:hypothetical protein
MARAEVSGERRFDAEIHRIAGEIEWSSSERKSPNAQRYSEQALDVARPQQARSLELRAATSLARLWGVQGRRKEARDLLARVLRGLRHAWPERGQSIGRGAGAASSSHLPEGRPGWKSTARIVFPIQHATPPYAITLRRKRSAANVSWQKSLKAARNSRLRPFRTHKVCHHKLLRV